MLGPFFPGKARRLLVRKEKRALNIEASFYGKSALLSYAKKVAKNPGGSARLKNMNSNANNWRIHIFSYGSLRFPPGPSLRPKSRACARLASARACGRRTAKLWHFSNAHETIRMTFVCSHPTDASKNDIGNRAGRDGVSGPHTGQHFAPRACGKALRRNNFPATAGAWLAALFQIQFSGTRAACERANVILTVSRATENATSFAVLRPQARAEANRAQARLLGRRLGSGAIGVTR